ncbi:hypothetical protein M3P05_10995 [Sansalvadorimonas sp. 2012CJ34-2]|uniref:Death domain-containing protein n=1 Tax=Parendozoicomonas callyspongiae TaxID=2942213 RepID=A0ABT0PGD6_9GAMM|nr:hypothetical protein [Sansalvadorimonas sp. 2012CJ34-2]MCL6270447.1 hypothetical protein [Sansalvadorimonas sp. 2012CJ34-2]
MFGPGGKRMRTHSDSSAGDVNYHPKKQKTKDSSQERDTLSPENPRESFPQKMLVDSSVGTTDKVLDDRKTEPMEVVHATSVNPQSVASADKQAAMDMRISKPALSYLFEAIIKCRFPAGKWKELGKALDVSPNTLSNMEIGNTPVRLRHCEVINIWFRQNSHLHKITPGNLLRILKGIDETTGKAIESAWCIEPQSASASDNHVNKPYVPFEQLPLEWPLSKSHLPQLIEHLSQVNFHKASWMTLGLALGLTFYSLDDIQLAGNGNVEQCARQVLMTWIEGNDYTEWRGPATMKRLCHVLHTIGESACAETLEQTFSGNEITPDYTSTDVRRIWQEKPWANETDVIKESDLPFILGMLEHLSIAESEYDCFDLFIYLGLPLYIVTGITENNNSVQLCVVLLLDKWLKEKADMATAEALVNAVKKISPEKGKKCRALLNAGGYHKEFAGQESKKELTNASVGVKDGSPGELTDNRLADMFVYIQDKKSSHFPTAKWRKLGQTLGLSDEMLNDIAAGPRYSQAFLVIWGWVNNFAALPGSRPPVQNELIFALKKIGETVAAEKLEQHLQTSWHSVASQPGGSEQIVQMATFDQLTLNSPLQPAHLSSLLKLLDQCSYGKAEWFPLGILMRLRIDNLRIIEKDNSGNVAKCFQGVLVEWLNWAGSSLIHAGPPTPALLVKFMRLTGDPAAADRMEAYFKSCSEK